MSGNVLRIGIDRRSNFGRISFPNGRLHVAFHGSWRPTHRGRSLHLCSFTCSRTLWFATIRYRACSDLLLFILLYSIHVDPAGGLFRIIRIPSILLASFSVFAASTSVGFLSATLEPHLRQFDLMPISMGLMFVIEGGIYAITAPVWGYLCDRKVQPKIVTLIGSIFIVVGFLLIGPAPFLPLDT